MIKTLQQYKLWVNKLGRGGGWWETWDRGRVKITGWKRRDENKEVLSLHAEKWAAGRQREGRMKGLGGGKRTKQSKERNKDRKRKDRIKRGDKKRGKCVQKKPTRGRAEASTSGSRAVFLLAFLHLYQVLGSWGVHYNTHTHTIYTTSLQPGAV